MYEDPSIGQKNEKPLFLESTRNSTTRGLILKKISALDAEHADEANAPKIVVVSEIFFSNKFLKVHLFWLYCKESTDERRFFVHSSTRIVSFGHGLIRDNFDQEQERLNSRSELVFLFDQCRWCQFEFLFKHWFDSWHDDLYSKSQSISRSK